MAENTGRVIQITGPAVDVQFTASAMPPIYEALRVVSDGFNVPRPINVVLEVQQHLGEGRVRAIAMEPTDGMVRGMKAIDLGGPIVIHRCVEAMPVPVGILVQDVREAGDRQRERRRAAERSPCELGSWPEMALVEHLPGLRILER